MKVIIDRIATEYQDQGSGKTVLFLHGWQDNLETFNGLTSFLSLKYRVVRLDLPGFGQTEKPKESWELDSYIGFILNFIDKIKINPDFIVGHSFGGRILIKGLARNKFKPEKAVLLSSAGVSRKKKARFLYKLIKLLTYIPPIIFYREKIREKGYKMMGSDYLASGDLKETFLKIISEDLTLEASKIKIPILLIWGRKDTETPLSDGVKLSEIITGSKLEIIDSGHFFFKEKPEEVSSLIDNFL